MSFGPHLHAFLTIARARMRQLGASTRVAVTALAVSAAALVGIANQEAFVGKAYRDPVGIVTIGYGETQGVSMGDTTTPQRALVQLLQSANAHARGIAKCIKVPLFQYEFDAFVSLAYNIGVAAFCDSTLVSLLNQGLYAEACTQILRWDKAGGQTLRGLTARRQAEYRTCIGEGGSP
jgi:lysozyme